MSQRVFMHVDEMTTKVMESIQRELSTVIENKISDIGKRVLSVHESLETISDEITNNSGDLDQLKKAYKELKESVVIVNNQLQTIQNGQKDITSIVEAVQENVMKLHVAIDSSNEETIKAIDMVLKQQESLLQKGISRNIEEILSLSQNITRANEKNNVEMKSQGEELKTISSNIALNLVNNTGLVERLDSMKLDGKTMNDSICLTQNQLNEIVTNIVELKNEVAYLKEPFFKRWFFKKKIGNI